MATLLSSSRKVVPSTKGIISPRASVVVANNIFLRFCRMNVYGEQEDEYLWRGNSEWNHRVFTLSEKRSPHRLAVMHVQRKCMTCHATMRKAEAARKHGRAPVVGVTRGMTYCCHHSRDIVLIHRPDPLFNRNSEITTRKSTGKSSFDANHTELYAYVQRTTTYYASN